MAKKKPDPQERQTAAESRVAEAAPDEETKPDVLVVPETTTEPEAPEPETPEPEEPIATQALPTRPDSRAKTAGNRTSPLPIDSLQLAENRERSGAQALPDEDTKTDHDRAAGPFPEEARTPRYTTTPLPLKPERAKSGMPPWVWALLGASSMLLLAGAIWFFFMRRPGATGAAAVPGPQTPASAGVAQTPPEAEVPPALRPYMEKAEKGDARAMAMLAVMYDNGLNVRQNKAEGRKWYERAAAAGNVSAKKWLEENPKK